MENFIFLCSENKGNINIFSRVLTQNINETIITFQFPSTMNMSTLFQFSQKNYCSIKGNYRPASSTLALFSKVFEELLKDQISAYFSYILFKNQCCFCKGHNN